MQDLSGTIANIARNVTKTSGDLLKTTKLSMSLSSEEGNLRNLHLEIGRKVHEIYQYGGSLGKFFDEKYMEIETCERKITEIKEQIGIIKGIRECPKCGKKVERTSEFCPKCGIRLEVGSAAVADAPATQGADSHSENDIRSPYPKSSNFHESGIHGNNVDIPPPPAPPIPPIPPMPTSPPQPTSWSAPSAPVHGPTMKICRICKSENESGTKFCLSCGRILD